MSGTFWVYLHVQDSGLRVTEDPAKVFTFYAVSIVNPISQVQCSHNDFHIADRSQWCWVVAGDTIDIELVL